MFYYKTNFSKKSNIFGENCEKPFVGGHDRFAGRRTPGDKNQCNLFCRRRRFEYFLSNNFFEKNNIFQSISEKLFLGGVTIFEGMGRRTTKMNITFSLGNRVPNTVFKVFSPKTPYRPTSTRKTGFGGTFSPISVVLMGRLFPKTIGFTHEWTRTNL